MKKDDCSGKKVGNCDTSVKGHLSLYDWKLTVHWHLINLGRVVQLDVAKDSNVFAGNEVDGNTLAAESSTTTDSVDVVLTIAGQVVVDDKGDLLNIDTTSPDISGDEDSRIALSEVLHNAVALLLGHLAVHRGDSEVGLTHLVGQPVDLATSVAEDDGLCDGKSVVEIAKGVELPFLLLDGDEVLLETFKSQLVTLDEDADGVGHELCGHVEHIVREGGRNDNDLSGRREVTVDIVDLLAETTVEQLVGFIQNEHLDVAGAQVAATDHVGDTSRSTRDDVLAVVELADVFADVGSTNACMALDIHVVAEGHDDGLNLSCQFTGGRQNKSWKSQYLIEILKQEYTTYPESRAQRCR